MCYTINNWHFDFIFNIQVLDGTNSHKVALKVAEILRKVSQGLVDNSGLDMADLLTFTYGIANEALPMLNPKK